MQCDPRASREMLLEDARRQVHPVGSSDEWRLYGD